MTQEEEIAALRAEIVNDNEVIAELRAANDALRAEVARCHACLEIDHEYQGMEMERVEIPMDKRANQIDGIEARDCTIRLQDAEIARLRAENEGLKVDNLRLSCEWSGSKTDVFEARREISRLRAALEAIANPVLTDPDNSLSRIARAALGKGEE